MNQPSYGVSETPAQVLAASSPQRSTLLLGLLCGASIVVLDFFIVLACLPAVERTLGATKAELQLILAVYAVANGSLLVVGGSLGDVFGRRRVMLWGVAAFALASLACGLATSTWLLICFRAAQGFAGALVQPQVLGLLTLNFDSRDRPRVFGLYAASLGFAGIAAQLLGGLLVGLLPLDIGWRMCFLLSVPLCLLSIVLARGAMEGTHGSAKKIDMFGAILLGLALACICTFLTLGREQHWPKWAFWALALGGICGLALLVWQRIGYASNAVRIIPVGILQTNRFWVSLVTIFCFYCGVASLYFILALHMHLRDGYSSIQVGLLFGWLATVFVVASTWRRLKDFLGSYSVSFGLISLFLGHLVMLAAGLFDNGFARTSVYILSSAFQGAGIGALMGPLMAAALSKAKPEQASVAGGLASSMQQVGNSIGISAIGLAYFGSAHAMVSMTGAVWYLCSVVLGLALVMRAASHRRS